MSKLSESYNNLHNQRIIYLSNIFFAVNSLISDNEDIIITFKNAIKDNYLKF